MVGKIQQPSASSGKTVSGKNPNGDFFGEPAIGKRQKFFYRQQRQMKQNSKKDWGNLLSILFFIFFMLFVFLYVMSDLPGFNLSPYYFWGTGLVLFFLILIGLRTGFIPKNLETHTDRNDPPATLINHKSKKDWRKTTFMVVALLFLVLLIIFCYFDPNISSFKCKMLVASFFGFMVFFGLITGYMAGMGRGNPSADRKKEPASFWLNFTFYLIIAISFAFPEIWKPVMDAIVRWRDPIV